MTNITNNVKRIFNIPFNLARIVIVKVDTLRVRWNIFKVVEDFLDAIEKLNSLKEEIEDLRKEQEDLKNIRINLENELRKRANVEKNNIN